MKRYSFYCSGGASRIIKFYQKHDISRYKVEFVVYDGGKAEVIKKLKSLFGSKLYIYENKFKKSISDFLLELLDSYKIDYMFCFGSKILKGCIVKKYKNKIINFHPSLLPAFPGLRAIDQALNSSVQILGNTAHFIDEGIDTGPIIMQSAISRAIYKDYEDVLSMQLIMLERIWDLLDNDKIRVVESKVIIDSEKNYQEFYTI